MANRRPYKIVEFDNGCMIPLSHTPNADGYFRIYSPNYKTRLPMMYRVIWEMHNGPIPDGYEIDHICRCRGCINPNHLRMLDGSIHATQSNRERYREIIEEAKKVWESNPSITGTDLGRMLSGFGNGKERELKESNSGRNTRKRG